MPARDTVFREDEAADDPRQVNFYNETLPPPQMRVSRIATSTARSENPRYRHLITNVEVKHADRRHELNVRSNFIVYHNRLDREESWLVGKREDLRRRAGPDLKIDRGKITLDHNVILSKNLNVYL